MPLPLERARSRIPIALSIAGSDPSGGAGIQADLKTFAALGVYGAAAPTALTAQNSHGVRAVLQIDAAFVISQIEAVLSDLRVDAIKIGMLGQAAVVEAVAELLAHYPDIPVVLDPVLASTSGATLLPPSGVAALLRSLLPRATIITPNLLEAAVLLNESIDAVTRHPARAGERLLALGARAVLLKGGHAAGKQSDDLFLSGSEKELLSAPRIETPHTHGTGCTLASAVAAGLAHGLSLIAAVRFAKGYVHEAIVAADVAARAAILTVGSGNGPLHHFYALWPEVDRNGEKA